MSANVQPTRHTSVLLAEVLDFLRPRAGGVYLDCTLGGGGYTRALAEKVGDGKVIALDRDASAIERAREAIGEELIGRCELVQANFEDAPQVLDELGVDRVDGIAMDLGISSDQLDDPSRGFSFEEGGALDMRMDPSQGASAKDLVNTLEAGELTKILRDYGEEPKARRLARRIVEARPIEDAGQLAKLAEGLYRGRSRVHPATRMFQALRIAVNDELGALERALESLPAFLAPGTRMAVVSFHSLEDRLVKRRFLALAHVDKDPVTGQPVREPDFKVITRKPVTAGENELAANARARSAKLRVLERSAA